MLEQGANYEVHFRVSKLLSLLDDLLVLETVADWLRGLTANGSVEERADRTNSHGTAGGNVSVTGCDTSASTTVGVGDASDLFCKESLLWPPTTFA